MASFTEPDDVQLRIEIIKDEDVAWVVLLGEADIASLADLEADLGQVELDGVKSVHLDVTELAFADTATVRRLTVFAKRAKQAGRHIETWGASRTLRTVAHLLEVQDDLGLTEPGPINP